MRLLNKFLISFFTITIILTSSVFFSTNAWDRHSSEMSPKEIELYWYFVRISINDKELRLQLERELKGKLLHLRESFFESADNKLRLKILFSTSFRAFLSMFPVIIHLKGIEVAEKRRILLDRTVDVLGLDKELFTKLWNIKEGKYKFSKGEGKKIWEGYIDQVRKIAFEIDKMPI